jgi:hypothetical protein
MEGTPHERSITRDVSRKIALPSMRTAKARMRGVLWKRFCLLLCWRFWGFCVSPAPAVSAARDIVTESVGQRQRYLGRAVRRANRVQLPPPNPPPVSCSASEPGDTATKATSSGYPSGLVARRIEGAHAESKKNPTPEERD